MPPTHHTANSPTTNHAQLAPLLAAQNAYSHSARKFSIPIANSLNHSQEDLAPFPTPENATLQLDHNPGLDIHYTYYPASNPTGHSNPFSQTLVVYLNGLTSTRDSWDASICSFLEKRIVGRLPYPSLLSYDRYGQAESDRNPEEREHDLMAASQDLRQFILQIWREHLDAAKPTHFPCLIFVCSGIGCALARLFTQHNPGTVTGLLFLDSIITDADALDIWPNPDSESDVTLPDGVSVQELRETRRKYGDAFGVHVTSEEGLSRRNLKDLLPRADQPCLEGYLGKGPYLTVVGHDWESFAEECRTFHLPFPIPSPLPSPPSHFLTYLTVHPPLSTPKLLTMTYANPAWRRYNEGLTLLTDDGRAIGPIVAVGCGHAIHVDGPGFVSDEVVSLLDRVVGRMEQVSER